MIAYADIKQGNITIYKEYNNLDQYFILLNDDCIGRGLTYEAAARLFNSYVGEDDYIPLF